MTEDENLTWCFAFQVKTPIVNAKSKVLVPGLPGHQAPIKGTTQGSEKRKKDTDTKEVGPVLTMMHQMVACCMCDGFLAQTPNNLYLDSTVAVTRFCCVPHHVSYYTRIFQKRGVLPVRCWRHAVFLLLGDFSFICASVTSKK